MFALLGKKGFEELKQKLEKRLKTINKKRRFICRCLGNFSVFFI